MITFYGVYTNYIYKQGATIIEFVSFYSIDHNDIFESVVQEFGVDEDKLNYYKNIFPHFRKMLMK